jgi:hypothetical protein
MTDKFGYSGDPRVGGGLSITWFSGEAEIPTHWSIVGINPGTGAEEAANGSLKYDRVKTDKTGRAVNYYLSPTDEGAVGNIDRIKVKKLS